MKKGKDKPGKYAESVIKRGLEKAESEGRSVRLLFVCLGNICRSPAAQGVMEKMAMERGIAVECDSAGFYGGHAGDLPDSRMRHAATARGYDLQHRSRKIHEYDLDAFDVIFGMDDSNMSDLHWLAQTKEQEDKLVKMSDFAVAFPSQDSVPDPYYGGVSGFEFVLDLLEDACGEILGLLK